ncbi:helix-turn-helix domain-containing protein [Saccharothrix sp. ST-888]|uniref:helix-turn-helix domain-containing protein n=1 Tax=Saccharothrix sp. ST-888 TaxID=1427391 RepID=UPI0009E34146|nr:helix-turn-helix domain-containing protein [Saccharothrix sp. ST-888]
MANARKALPVTIGKSLRRVSRRPSADPSGAVPEQQVPVEPAAEAESIGRVLAAARLAAGMTVDQVSVGTRVRVPIVYAIEDDDFSRCGGDFYARGHIRSIARAVGVDSEPLIARYDAAHGGAPGPQRPTKLLDTGPIKVTDHRRPNWTTAMMVAIVAVVVLIGFNLFAGKPTHPTAGSPQSAAAPQTAPVQPPAPAPSTAPPSSAAPSAIAAAPADKVTVKLVAEKDTSWVSATDSTGKSLFQNNLDQGTDQTFTDPKQIKLVIGNAAAVHVYVNGKDLGPAGEDGQVVHLTYTPGDPQAG